METADATLPLLARILSQPEQLDEGYACKHLLPKDEQIERPNYVSFLVIFTPVDCGCDKLPSLMGTLLYHFGSSSVSRKKPLVDDLSFVLGCGVRASDGRLEQ